MMCLTLRMSTANCMTDRQLRSVCTTMLAMLRWTNTSPGSSPVIWLAGTRLSEQPIHRYSGACWFDSRWKNSASSATIRADHLRLFSSRCFSPSGIAITINLLDHECHETLRFRELLDVPRHL